MYEHSERSISGSLTIQTINYVITLKKTPGTTPFCRTK